MPETIAFTVEGEAVAKGRPIYSGKTRTHRTPKKTAHWEAFCRLKATQAMAGRPPLEGPVEMHVTVYRPIPKSWPGWKHDAALCEGIWPTGRPDLDNYVKAVSDACNTVVFRDDSQICTCFCTKWYSSSEAVVVSIQELPGEPASKARRST